MQDGQFHIPEYKPIFFKPEDTGIRLPVKGGFNDNPELYDNVRIANQSGFTNWVNNFFQGINDTQIGIAGSDLMDGLVKKANIENSIAALDSQYMMKDIDEFSYLNEKNKLLDGLYGAYNTINTAKSSILEDEQDKARRPISKAYQWKANMAMMKGPNASLYEDLGYTLPNVAGSSAATLGATMAAGFVGEVASNLAARAAAGSVAGPVGTALGAVAGLATVFSINAYARNLETKAEVGQQFLADYEKLKLDYLDTKEPGYVITPEEDNKLILQASQGADTQYWKNMSLAASDSIQSLLFAGAFSKMLKGVSNTNKFTRLGSRLGELYVQRKLEGLEEGLQYAFQKEKQDASLGLKSTESFGKSLLNDYRDVLSSMNYFGIQADGKYTNDKEFQASVNAGELLGTFFGGVKTTINVAQDLNNYRSTTKELAALNPTKVDQPILRFKDEIYKNFFQPKSKFFGSQDAQDRVFFFKEGLKTLNKKLDKEGKPLLSNEELVQELQDIDKAYETFSKVSDTVDAIVRPFGVNKSSFEFKKNEARGEIFANSMALTRGKDVLNKRQSEATQAVDQEAIEPGLLTPALIKANLEIVNKRLQTTTPVREEYLKSEKKRLEKELKDLQQIAKDSDEKEVIIPDINQVTSKALELVIDAKENLYEATQEREELNKIKNNKSLDAWFEKYKKSSGSASLKQFEDTVIEDNKDYAESLDRSKDLKELTEEQAKQRAKENRDTLQRAGYGKSYIDTLSPEVLDLEASKVLEEFKQGKPLTTEDFVLSNLIQTDKNGKFNLTKEQLDLLLTRPSFRAKFLSMGFNPDAPIEQIVELAAEKLKAIYEERSKNKQRKSRAGGTFSGSVGRVKNSLDRRETDDYVKQFGIQEGKAKQRIVLQSIISSPYSTDAEKELAKKYLELAGEDVITFGEVKDRDGNPVAGQYNRNGDTVTIDLQFFGDEFQGNIQAIESAILHELTHKYTVKTMAADQTLLDEVKAIMAEAKKITTSEQFRGLESPFEFVAEVMTNPKFQELLAKGKGTKQRTLWEEFVNAVAAAIKRVLGIDISGTLLEDSIELTADIIGKNAKTALVGYQEAKTKEINEAFAKIDVNDPNAKAQLDKVHEDVYIDLLNEIAAKPALEGIQQDLADLIHKKTREYETLIKKAQDNKLTVEWRGKTYKKGQFVAIKGYNDPFEIQGVENDKLLIENDKGSSQTNISLDDPDQIEFVGDQAEAAYFIQQQKQPKEQVQTYTPTAFFKSTGKQVKEGATIEEELDEHEVRYYNFLNVLAKIDSPYKGLLIQDGNEFQGIAIPHSKATADYLASGGKAGQIVIVVDSNNQVVLFDENGLPSANGLPITFNIETPETIMKRNSGTLAKKLGLTIAQVNEIKLASAKTVREARAAAASGTPVVINFKSVSSGVSTNTVVDELDVRPITEAEAQQILDIANFLATHKNQQLKDFLFYHIEGINKDEYDISGGKFRKNKQPFTPTVQEIMTHYRFLKSYVLTEKNKPHNVMKVEGNQILVAAQYASYQEYLKTITNLNSTISQDHYNRYIIYEFGGTLPKSEEAPKVEENKPEPPKFDGGDLFDTPALRAEKYEELRKESENFKSTVGVKMEPLPVEPDEKHINELIKLALEDKTAAINGLGEKAVSILYDWATYKQVYDVYKAKVALARSGNLALDLNYLEELLEAKSETFDTPASPIGLSSQSTYYLVRSLDKGVHNYLRKGQVDGELSYIKTVAEAMEDPNFVRNILNEVRTNLLGRLERLKAERPNDETIQPKIDKITKDWAQIVNYYLKNSYVFSYDRKLEFSQDENGELIKDDDNTKVAKEKGFDKVGNEISPIDGASKETKALVRGLSKFKKVGNVWTRVLNEFNVPDLVNFAVAWNNLIKNIQGLTTFEDVLEKIDSLIPAKNDKGEFVGEGFPEYEELIQILRKYYAYAQIGDVEARKMIALFERDLRKPEIPIIEVVIETDGKGSTVYKISEATRKNIKELKTQFQTFFLQKSSYRSKTTTGNIVLNPKIVNHATAKKADRVKFFEGLGFDFSNQTINDPLFDELTTPAIINLFKMEIQAHTNNKVFLKNPIEELSKGTKYSEGLAKRITALIDLESKYSKTAPSLSMQNVEGNTEWAISNPNTYTIVTDAINDVKRYPTFQDLVANPAFAYLNFPYARTSHGLNQIFILDSETNFGQRRDNVNPVTIRMINNSGVAIEGVDGKKTTSLYIGDKIVSDINQLLKVGYKEGVRAGDKNSAFGADFSGFYQDGRLLRLPIGNFEYFKEGYGGEQMFRIMEGYLVGELARIYLGIHNYLSDINKMDSGRDRLVREFSLFRDILPKDVKSEMRAKLTALEGLEPNTPGFYEAIGNIAKDYMSKNEIRNSIISFFQQGIRDKLASLNKYGFTFNNSFWLDDSLKGYSKETLLKAYIINEFILFVEQTKIFNGDVAFYSTKDGEFHKRISKDGATGLHPMTDAWWVEAANLDSNNNLGAKLLGVTNPYSNSIKTVVFQENTVPSNYIQEWIQYFREKGYSTERIDRIVRPYMTNKEADAQGWITMDFYRNFKLGIGSWTTEQERVYERVSKGEALTPEEVEDLGRLFPAIKAQYSGSVEHMYYHVPAFHKFSLMPLIPSMIKGTSLEHLNERMLRNNVSYGLMESGSKVGTIAKDRLEPVYVKKNMRIMEDPTKPFENYNVIHLQFLKEQVQLEPDFHSEVIFGTQFRKLLFQNVYSEGVAAYPKFAELERAYSQVIDEITDYHKISLIEEMGLEPIIKDGVAVDYKIIDEEKLVKKLIDEVERRKLNNNIKDFFQLENGKLKWDIDASQNNQQIRNMIMSMINSRLIRQTITGDMMVQGSSLGFEKFTNPTEEQKLEYGTNGLRFYHVKNGKTRAMQVKVALIGDFKHLLNFEWKGEKIGSLAKLNQAIKDPEWLELHKKTITMLGYRIPTQGLNSIEFMEIAEFLPPEAGNIIIVPSEIVTKAGSDFDIDKLNVFKPSLRFDEKTNEAWYVNRSKKISKTKIQKLAERQERIDRLNETIQNRRYYEKKYNSSQNPDDLKAAEGNRLEEGRIRLELGIFQDEYEEVKSYLGGLYNTIIELAVERLSDENSFEELLTPNSTDLIKPIAEEELGVAPKSYKHTANLTSLTQEEKYLAGLPNKRALGIAAVANTFSQLLAQSPLKLNRLFRERHVNHPMLKNKEFSLSKKHLETGVLKSEIESQMINAYVDVLNDDFIAKANLSFDTAGLFFYLLHLGHDHQQLFYFFNHPVVKEIVASNQARKSLIIKNAKPGYSPKLAKKVAFSKVTGISYLNREGNERSLKSMVSEAGKSFDAKYFTKEHLKSMLGKKLSEVSEAERQALAYYFENATDESNQLIELQQINNYDTATSVNPIAHDYREYLKLQVEGENLFNGNVEGPTENTVIKPFNQYYLISSVLNQLLTTSLNKNVRDGIIDIIREYEDDPDVDLDHDKLTRVFINDWIYYIYANFGKTKDGERLGVYGRNLLFGKEMSEQLTSLKIEEKWAALRQDFPIIDQLRVDKEESTDATASNILLYRDDNSSDYQNNLIDQLLSLGNYEGMDSESNLFVKRFFRNLALLGFSQSGLNKGPFYFTDIIPNEFYVPLMDAALKSFKALSEGQQKLAFNDFFLRFKSQNPTMFGYAQKDIKTFRYKNYISVNNQEFIGLTFEEDQSAGYAARTARNASADATIAIAVDFESAGEKLTKSTVKGQGKLYVPIDVSRSLTASPQVINAVVERLNKAQALTLNIAGNGIYTMKGKYTQAEVDEYTYQLLKGITEHPDLEHKIVSIRTGGQTGFDEAGAKAGMRLGIPTLILAPKGWKFRNEQGQDISDESQFKNRFSQSGRFNAEVKGINIYTKSNDPLGRALTNPTWGSVKDGKNYFDVETEYKKQKTGDLAKDMQIMQSLIEQKLRQNPELITEIDSRGGEAFLAASSHEVGVKGSRWEGKGLESNFIKVLISAYRAVKNLPPQEGEQLNLFNTPALKSQENVVPLQEGTFNGILKTLLENGIITPYCD